MHVRGVHEWWWRGEGGGGVHVGAQAHGQVGQGAVLAAAGGLHVLLAYAREHALRVVCLQECRRW